MNQISTGTKGAKPAHNHTLAVTQKPRERNSFGKFVADKAMDKAEQTKPVTLNNHRTPGSVARVDQHGRKPYAMGTLGDQIWKVAEVLQLTTPKTPVTAAAVRIALPHIKATSVAAGLSHWRKYKGTAHKRI